VTRPIIEKWNQKKFLGELGGEIAIGMDRACEMVADKAAPMAPVMTGLTRADITHEIDVRGLEIEGRVGVKRGKGHAWYAHFPEFGTSKMAARPFLRPAVFQNASAIVKMIAEATK